MAEQRVLSWWGQPDHFDWVEDALAQRGLLSSARVVMAVIAASSSLVPLTVLLYPRSLGLWALLFAAVAAGFSVWITGYWLTRWPTRRHSQIIAVLGALTITGWVLCQANSALAALGCTAMAVTGGYLAFFHSVKLVTVNLALAALSGAVAALRLAAQTSIVIAAAAFWLVWLLNLAVPVAIRAIACAMRTLAQRADVDPLTGLFNRRGFLQRITAEVMNRARQGSHLLVLMVDLDDFKSLNDTHGHPAGDRALIAVADLLRRRSPAAVLCRAGGEEFLIAYVAPDPPDGPTLANELCHAIPTLPYGLTASIGTATAILTPADMSALPESIDELIASADTCMYRAKRLGGNQTHHH